MTNLAKNYFQVQYRLRGWLEEVEQHGEPELQAFARNLHKEESPYKQD